jgi:hypothetical protein
MTPVALEGIMYFLWTIVESEQMHLIESILIEWI